MPSNVTAKTGLVLKRLQVAILVAAVVALFVSVWLLNKPQTRTLSVGNHHYTLEVATTTATQEKGLGYRPTMAHDHGMLFIFPGQEQQCFWMKGMEFPLDIIWTDSAHRVVNFVENLSPDTYPQTYCSPGAASDVIELNAGQAVQFGIHTGQVLNF